MTITTQPFCSAPHPLRLIFGVREPDPCTLHRRVLHSPIQWVLRLVRLRLQLISLLPSFV